MPADILLYALIAAGLIFWLRSILGTRHEDEDPPRFLSEDEKDPFSPPAKKESGSDKSNIINLDNVVGQRFDLPLHIRIDNKTAENNLEDLAKKYPDFDLNHFLEGAQHAFPMIIEAFADGDKETLQNVLVKPVYDAFEKVIEEREKRGEKVETEVKSVEKIDVVEAIVKDDIFYITLRFTARETCVIRDKSGEIISGDPDRTTQMIDIWVFGRELNSDGPEWYLYETRDDEIEDHKTPIPEAGKEQE